MSFEEEFSIRHVGTPEPGKPQLLVLRDTTEALGSFAEIESQLSKDFAVYTCNSPTASAGGLREKAAQFAELLSASDLKRIILFGIGRASWFAQYMTVFHPKLFRRLILLDASSRQQPSGLQVWLERISLVLPSGFPLRVESRSADTRWTAHRVAMPALLLLSPKADHYSRQEILFLQNRIPNCWKVELQLSQSGEEIDAEQFRGVIKEFSDVPVKRPQKNRARASAKPVEKQQHAG